MKPIFPIGNISKILGKNFLYTLLGAITWFLCMTVLIYLLGKSSVRNAEIVIPVSTPSSQISEIPTLSPAITSLPSPTNTPSPAPKPISNKIIFGIGSQAGPAMDFRLVKEAPVKMLTSWYNGTSDLDWMRVQQNDLIPRLYENKYIVHLITWSDLPEIEFDTSHGHACGRPYPVSEQVVTDMRELARIYNGSGPMYVSLFTEFQTYTCVDNNWNGNEAYWQTLKDNYRKIKDIFHSEAPYSKVSLSWGGWQSSYDDFVNQGGRSLFPHFADIIQESDFASFQSMESDTNIDDITNMTKILGSYGKQVMISHYKPANASSAVFENDLKNIFTDEKQKELVGYGLFAFSFMDSEIIDHSESSYQTAKNVVVKYGK